MARDEADREDLYAEASAFVRRIEFSCREFDNGRARVVAGYRRNGVLSIYLSTDEMYQFTIAGELRRALRNEALFRTQGTTLARLVRQRSPTATELLRYDLTEAELATFLTEARNRLTAFLDAVRSGTCRIVRQEPANGSVAVELVRSLEEILTPSLRLAPALPTKRR